MNIVHLNPGIKTHSYIAPFQGMVYINHKMPTFLFLAVYYFYSEQQSKTMITVSVLKGCYKLPPKNRILNHFKGSF